VTRESPGEASRPQKCPDARAALRFYRAKVTEHRAKMGAGRVGTGTTIKTPARPRKPRSCADARYLVSVWKVRARAAREALKRWEYHYAWWKWLPDKWQRIGACETGYGRRPGNWRHSNSSYEGAFGFAKSSWDGFKGAADPKAGPYPADAWMATPRQQYEVALAIFRRYGFSGWGCRNA
jgi:hypothetical protein